ESGDRHVQVAGCELDQQRRLQRPMDNETGIGLFTQGIRAIVVNAMPVHRQRRVTEQKNGIWIDVFQPGYGRHRSSYRLWQSASGRLAVNEILLLADRNALPGVQIMAHCNKDQTTAAA